jgi:competence protein ComGC
MSHNRMSGSLGRGWTLLEVMIVILIIMVLAGISYMLIAPRARVSADEVKCRSNLRQLAASLNIYMSDYDGWPAPSLLALESLEPACPIDLVAYDYSGNFVALNRNGRSDWVANFEPNRHPVIKCIQHHTHKGAFEIMRFTNIRGEEVARRVPLLEEGQLWRVLSVLLDGSVRYRPFIDDYMTDLDRDAPPPR